MSDSVKAYFEMQEEIKVSLQADEEMAKAGIGQEFGTTKYVFLLDFNDGKVYRYDISALGNKQNGWNPDYESCEAFLIGAGHAIQNCEWMVTTDHHINEKK